jgi:SCP-2 sterol transfer family protein
MAIWLSNEWAEEAAGLAGLLPPVPDITGTVSLAVIGPAKREVQVRWQYQAGTAGTSSDDLPSAVQLSMTLSSSDAVEVITGEVEPSVAFMRGRLKATGDGALLLGFLESTTNEAYEIWRERVAALAEETSATDRSP